MRSSATACTTMVWLTAAALLLGLAAHSALAEQREYQVFEIEPQKSDIVRLVEAYERLSDQYLSLVQHQLQNMDAADKQILTQLRTLEKKIDDLSARVDKLTAAQPATPPGNAGE